MAFLDHVFGKLLRAIAIACLSLLLLLLGANVIARVTGWFSLGWYDEVIELFFAWMVFIGAAALWRENEHFRIDWLAEKLPGGASRAHGIIITLINLFFLYFLAWEGLNLTMRSSAVTPIIGLPVALLYVCIPLSATIMGLYSLSDLIRLLRGRGAGYREPHAPIDDL